MCVGTDACVKLYIGLERYVLWLCNVSVCEEACAGQRWGGRHTWTLRRVCIWPDAEEGAFGESKPAPKALGLPRSSPPPAFPQTQLLEAAIAQGHPQQPGCLHHTCLLPFAS